jgi:hypothetical protein
MSTMLVFLLCSLDRTWLPSNEGKEINCLSLPLTSIAHVLLVLGHYTIEGDVPSTLKGNALWTISDEATTSLPEGTLSFNL